MPAPASRSGGARPRTRGDRTRAAVVAAATARFQAHGYAGTTTAEVADDAGVAEGTVFLHFGSKAGLLTAVMRAYYDELVADVERVAAEPGTAPERLRRLVTHWIGRMDADWTLVSVFAQQARFTRDGEIPAAFAEMNRRVTRITAGVIEDLKAAGALRAELPTRLLRDAIFGTVEHVMIARVHTGRPRDLAATGDHLLDLLLNGALTQEPAPPPPALAAVDAKLDAILARLGPGPA